MGESSGRGAYHHGNLREGLIEASLEILERDGLPGLGLRAAARAAGVSQTAPYHHFEGKEGLLAAVAARGFRIMQAEQDRIMGESSDLDPDARVRELGVGYVRMALRFPELFKLMFGPTIPNRDDHAELKAAYEDAYAVIEQAIADLLLWRRGRAEPDEVAIAVAAAWATVHGLAILVIDGRLRPGQGAMPDADALVRNVLQTVSFGLSPPD